MKIFLCILVVLSISITLHSQNSQADLAKLKEEETYKAAIEYINKYKYIAISEMLLNGIPASIKLAQGLLETDNGRSILVLNTNNHFGIKCHKGWKGNTYHHDDDAPQECFRKYDDDYDSYRDHSVFLRTRPWYSFLFSLNRHDYKAWAHGLKKAGYATNQHYAIGLIRRIEEFKLYEFDHYSSLPTSPNELFAVESKKKENNVMLPDTIYVERLKPCSCEDKIDYFNEFVIGNTTRKVCLNNDVKYTIARKGDSYYRIAKDFNIELSDLYRYNDLESTTLLLIGQILYLEKKRKTSNVDYHIVAEGQTLLAISQLYGIRLKHLLKKNKIKHTNKVSSGQKLWLSKKIPVR